MDRERTNCVRLPALKKRRGSVLLEACAGLLCLAILLQGALQLVTQGVRGLRYLKGRWELQRASQDLRTRLETYLLYQADVVQTLNGGTIVICYGHDRIQRREFSLKVSKTANCRALYSESWSAGASQGGVNPLSPPHIEVTELKATRLSGHIVHWRMMLTYRPTGAKREFSEVFHYGQE